MSIAARIARVKLALATLVSTAMPMMSAAVRFTLTSVESALRRIGAACAMAPRPPLQGQRAVEAGAARMSSCAAAT
jgi:hypothetical protein